MRWKFGGFFFVFNLNLIFAIEFIPNPITFNEGTNKREIGPKYSTVSEICPDQFIDLEVNIPYHGQVKEGQHCLMTFKQFGDVNQNTRLKLEVSLILPPSQSQSKIPFIKDPLTAAILHSYDLDRIKLPMDVTTHFNETRRLTKASRIICFQYNENGLEDPTDIDILFHTDNDLEIRFEVKLVVIQVPKLELDKETFITITQNSPIYLHFDFNSTHAHQQGYLQNTLVSLESDSSSCMTFSIQRPQCPNYDRESNVKFEGIWQTVSKSGLINVERHYKQFENGFYVVLVLHSSFNQCYLTDQDENGEKWIQNIEKNMTLKVLQDYPGPGHYWSQIWTPIAISLFCCIIPLVYIVFRKFWDDGESIYEQILKNHQNKMRKNNPTPANLNPPENLEDKDQNQGKFGNIVVSDLYDNRFDLGGQSSYPCLLFTMSLFFTVPVLQLLRNNLQIFWDTGNFDFCYYNFKCAHPIEFPLFNLYDGNHVLSNIPYIFFGLSFYFIALRKNRIMKKLAKYTKNVNLNDKDFAPTGLPVQDNGVYRAMGLALAMEGVLSASYHICPTEVNFQFDTVYMYVISFLGIVKIIQARHAIHPSAHTTFIVVASFSVISVFGVIADSSESEPFRQFFYWTFFLVHISVLLLSLFLMYFIGFKVTIPRNVAEDDWVETYGVLSTSAVDGAECGKSSNKIHVLFQYLQLDTGIFGYIFREFKLYRLHNDLPMIIWSRLGRTIILLVPNLYMIYSYLSDMNYFPSHLLNILLANFGVLLLWYVACKLYENRWRLRENCFFWQSASYLLFFLVVFGVAYLMFFIQFLTEWQMTPALSREQNEGCYDFEFYDAHDLWHFLSAVSLFSGFMFLLTLDDDLVGVPREEIYIF